MIIISVARPRESRYVVAECVTNDELFNNETAIAYMVGHIFSVASTPSALIS